MPGNLTHQAALLALPLECCHLVFSFLDLRGVMGAASTCQALRAIAKVHVGALFGSYVLRHAIVLKTRQLMILSQDDTFWRGIAEIKWGDDALQLGRDSGLAGDGLWFGFCQHRICLRSSQ